MKKNFLPIILLLILLSTILYCKSDPKLDDEVQKSTENANQLVYPKLSLNRKNLNVSVLLDLSDRIDPKKYPAPSMEFYLRDIGYLKSLAENFEAHVMNKRVIKIDDKLQVFIDPEPSDKTLNDKLMALKIAFNKNNATKKSITTTSLKYEEISKLIYEAAINDNNYVGSDIWKFFKNKVDTYCIEEGYRNILVVLTDGYIYHVNTKIKEKNRTTYLTPQDIRSFGLNRAGWVEKFESKDFGFKTVNADLSNIEVLVLGINPNNKNPYEEDVIRAYWEKWFKEMNIKNFEIKQAELPSHMEKVIGDFILKE